APETTRAVDEVCSRALEQLKAPVSLAIVFFSTHHASSAETIASTLHEKLSPRCLLGCIGESIVGNEQEVEHRPALSLWLGSWSRPIELEPFHLKLEHTPAGPTLLGWP